MLQYLESTAKGVQVSIDEIASLNISQKIMLVEEIWDSIAQEQEQVAITDEERAILDERLSSFEANSDDVISWEEIKQRLHA